MNRRRQIQSQPSVSLFPFLAVLICTMGTLIVLLVVVVQQARKTGDDPSSAPVAQMTPTPRPVIQAVVPVIAIADDEAIKALEDARWANEILAKSREETRLTLEERRGNLSRIEDQSRALSEKLDLLEAQAQALLDAEAKKFAPSEHASVELENVRLDLIETKRVLTIKQAEAAKRRKQYAIIPFVGKNGTRRRPIYIECLSDAVVMQPEGLRFGARDFSVRDAGNPLASALRAYREYFSNAGLIESGGEPYPLIIVRPNGGRAYNACKSALRSWDDEFGYELVPTEMELAYPEKDDGLVAFLEDAVAQARSRIPANIVEARSRSGGSILNGPEPVGPRGGNANGAPRGLGGGDSSFVRASRNGVGRAVTASTASADDAPTYSLGQGVGGGLVPNGAFARSEPRRNQSGTSSRRRQVMSGARRANAPSANTGSTVNASYGSGTGTGSGTGAGSGSGYGAASPQSSSANANTGHSVTAANAVGGPNAAGGSVDQAGATGSGGSSDQGSAGSGSSGGGQGGQASQATLNRPAAESSFSPAGAVGMEGGDSTASVNVDLTSLAKTQGENWALPNAAVGSIGISRPLMAWCETNRIVVKTDRGQVVVPIVNGSVAEAVQPLVTKIWQIIDGWGIAGSGAYWKPTVHVRVQPGAERAFEKLSALLQDSGLDIKRRQ